jgi:glycosyltransferase involved in cell wall biosynthesis
MYPDERHPSYGIFVKKFSDELEKIKINYTKSVMYKKDNKVEKIFGYIFFYLKTLFMALFGSYDVIYIHYASHSSAPVLTASKLKKLTIYTNVHGSDVVPENNCQNSMQTYTKKILSISKKIIVPSQYFKNYVKEKYNIKEDMIFVYPSAGIDKNVFHELGIDESENIKMMFFKETNLPTFGMAGRISSGKGWDVFVKAIRIAKDRGVNGNYVIVGTGTEEECLDKLIQENNLENVIKRIQLLPQDKLCEFYNAIDYFVFPTKREGESLGLVALEAMACGTPVIASNFAAPKHYINSGVNGYKFEVNNASELADKIIFCSENRNLRGKLREGALETAKQYESEHVRSELLRIFDF